MANSNTFLVIPDLPVQTIATANAVLTVPAAGLYSGYPSPGSVAGSAFTLTPNDTIVGGIFDDEAFKVRILGVVTVGAGNSTFTPAIYIGTSTTVGSNTSLGIGTATGSLTAATSYQFWLEATVSWNATTQKITGFYQQEVNGVLQNSGTPTAITPTSVTAVSLLNFLPTFSFGTTQAGNSVQVGEFALDRD